MCVIITSKSGLPTSDLLKKAELINPDGGGVAWVEDYKVLFKKGITATEIEDLRDRIGKSPCLAHFRIATAGGVSKELCHPFPMDVGAPLHLEGASKNGVFMHNGHVRDWEEILVDSLGKAIFPKGNWSDSRAIAHMAGIYGPSVLTFYSAGQKFASLTPDGVINRYGSGWCEEGDYFTSNRMWQFNHTSRHWAGYTWDEEDYEDAWEKSIYNSKNYSPKTELKKQVDEVPAGSSLMRYYKALEEAGYIPDEYGTCNSLYLTYIHDMTELPADLYTIQGTLDLTGCSKLEQLNDYMNIQGDLVLQDCCSLTELPAGLFVGGDLFVYGSKLDPRTLTPTDFKKNCIEIAGNIVFIKQLDYLKNIKLIELHKKENKND